MSAGRNPLSGFFPTDFNEYERRRRKKDLDNCKKNLLYTLMRVTTAPDVKMWTMPEIEIMILAFTANSTMWGIQCQEWWKWVKSKYDDVVENIHFDELRSSQSFKCFDVVIRWWWYDAWMKTDLLLDNLAGRAPKAESVVFIQETDVAHLMMRRQ